MKTRYGTSYYLSREKESFLVVDDDKYEEAKEHALLFIKDPSCFYITPKHGKELVEIEDDIIKDFRLISKTGEEELIDPSIFVNYESYIMHKKMEVLQTSPMKDALKVLKRLRSEEKNIKK